LSELAGPLSLDAGEKDFPPNEYSVKLRSGVEAAAEKLRDLSSCEQNHPSAAEAGPLPLDLSARINPCSFKTASDLSFSAQYRI
jgi:hypothetical protein